jgi:hypothetical protein
MLSGQSHKGLLSTTSPEVIEGMMTDFANPDAYPVEGIAVLVDDFPSGRTAPRDGRGITYSYAYFSPRHLGSGRDQ